MNFLHDMVVKYNTYENERAFDELTMTNERDLSATTLTLKSERKREGNGCLHYVIKCETEPGMH